jgi:hypothetical protein
VKDSEEGDLPQDELVLLEEKKKDPISKFFSDLKGDIQGLSQKSDDFFLKVKEDWNSEWQEFTDSWNNWIKDIKEKSPKYRRFKKLYSKMKEMDDRIKEIRADTQEIKLDISHVAFMIETLMEDISDIEDYMKENLGSDWKILKSSWQKCKIGEISKGEFVKIGLSKVGKKFAGIFLKV